MHERKSHVEYSLDLNTLTRKKRVCAYARVSSSKDEAFHSLSAQISYYQKKIAEHPDWEFVEVFADRGITGTKENREGFQRMLTACREGKVDIVLAKSITRFARNTVILLNTVRELKSLGIDIHFEEEHIETLSEKGELMISILAARAQEESRSASENVLWRIRKSYEKGIPTSGNCLGYRMVDHKFLIEEDEEKTVIRIFNMYLSGMGTPAIVKALNADGTKTRFGNTHWTRSAIFNIIRNEKYCGDLILQKSYVSDHISKKLVKNNGERKSYYIHDDHDAIIDRETFDAVQAEMARRAEFYKHKTGKKKPQLFSGLLRCGKCGRTFWRKYNVNGAKGNRHVWICATSNTMGKDYCDAQQIPESILIQTTCETLDVAELDETFLRSVIQEIQVPEKNTLVYVFKDGTSKPVKWQFRSRKEAWTPEMKEQARQRTLARYTKHKNKEEENNGA